MANILYLDTSVVAGNALKGILARANHHCVVAQTIEEAFDKLRELVCIDLVIIELRLHNQNGITFIRQLRSNSTFKDIPIVVYSVVSDHGVIQAAISLKIQSYLSRPFDDEAVYREVKKAVAYPWRSLQFGEEKAFCAQMGMATGELKKMREGLLLEIDRSAPDIEKFAEAHDILEVNKALVSLGESAESCGAGVVTNVVNELRKEAEELNWAAFAQVREDLMVTRRVVSSHLNPGEFIEGLYSEEERKVREEAGKRSLWVEAGKKNALPLVTEAEVKSKLDALVSCPVMESVAAAFQLLADGTASSLGTLLDIVSRDPGLSVLVLVAANHLRREGSSVIEDPRLGASLLGEIKLNALAKGIPTIGERHLNVPPLSWSHYWMFQVGVGQLAKFTCDYLDLRDAEPYACTAGLVHDFGKLLMLRLYPFALEAVVDYAKVHKVSVGEAEKRILGVTTTEMAVHFALKHGLPTAYVSAIRWVDSPQEAAENQELVAAVALAKHLCVVHKVGHCVSTATAAAAPLESTAAWKALEGHVFPSFNLKKFDVEARGLCLNLRQELLGKERRFLTSDGN
jgi:CheY-like chemotaxis protein